MLNNAELGARLLARRQELKFSRSEMAARTGISRNRLARLEHGKGSLSPAEIMPLLSGYETRLAEWLMTAPDSDILKAPLWQLTRGERRAVVRLVDNLVKDRAPSTE